MKKNSKPVRPSLEARLRAIESNLASARKTCRRMGVPRVQSTARLSMDSQPLSPQRVNEVVDWCTGDKRPRRTIRLALLDDVRSHGIPAVDGSDPAAPAPVIIDLDNALFIYQGREISGQDVARALGLDEIAAEREQDAVDEARDQLGEQTDAGEPAHLSMSDAQVDGILAWQFGA